MNFLRAVWLTDWCIVIFAIGAFFLLANDQGRDLMVRLVEARGLRFWLGNVSFLVGASAWSLSTWYCARLLFTRRFPHTDDTFFQQTRKVRILLPRVGGGLVPFVVAVGFSLTTRIKCRRAQRRSLFSCPFVLHTRCNPFPILLAAPCDFQHQNARSRTGPY